MQFSLSMIGCLFLLLSISSTATLEPSPISHKSFEACKHNCHDPPRHSRAADQCLSRLGSAQDMDNCMTSIRAEAEQCSHACELIHGLLRHYTGNGTCFGHCLEKFLKTANILEPDHH